tara:strand:- start:644 stop:901 length:258 start_codon:yes stop_codon:yes gene_type:complete
MIDTDKYEPTWIDWILHNTREHSSDGWRELSKSLIELSDDDRELIANAPILLAEVKRLREQNRSLFLRLSKVQGQLNAIHRGEEE